VDSLLNFETVKYFNNERHETRRYDQSMERYSQASVQSQISLSILNTGQAAIMALGQGLVLVLAAMMVKSGEVKLGQFVAANLIIIQLYQPLNLLGTVYREITQGLVDMEAMFRLLHQPQEVQDRPGATPLMVAGGEIKFDNVVFGYDPERVVLKGISFTVPAGKTVAIVGPSGAGKSTIGRLLFRFYDPWAGRILIDGQDIREVTQESLRAQIGIVPQDSVLFNDTIGYNVAYGRDGADQDQVIAAARDAAILPFIEMLPQGFHTEVGERGLKLSGGEKQRVAIARTLLKNPPILLLDEATSALDTRTEQDILTTLHRVSEHRTTLAIAHRLSTVADADTIFVLDHGRLAESGSHAALLKRNGLYAEMWNRQLAEREQALDEAAE
jgi:ATP-binding cassette subfamily B protein